MRRIRLNLCYPSFLFCVAHIVSLGNNAEAVRGNTLLAVDAVADDTKRYCLLSRYANRASVDLRMISGGHVPTGSDCTRQPERAFAV